MVYDVNGDQLNELYGKDGTSLDNAYDVDGNPVFHNNTLVVMSFNIARWRGANSDTTLMNNIFSTYKPMVCGVQETGANGELKYIGTQFESGRAMANEVTNKCGYLFNIAYTDYSDNLYETQGGEVRGYQKCYIRIDGKNIALFNTHLAAYSQYRSTRIAQAMELLEEMQNEQYCIAVGDFNMGAATYEDYEYIYMAKPYVDAGFNMANWKTGLIDTWFDGSTVEGSTSKHPTDNIIASPNIDIDLVVVDESKLAVCATTGQEIDHLPIVAHLTVH